MSTPGGKKRVTLAEIGKACGYHGSTVGLALKNSPKIPLKTRELIQKVATEMDYHPDPALAALVAYRHQNKNPQFHSKIALITDQKSPNAWLGTEGYGQLVIEGITQSAIELGYEIEIFYVGLNREHEQTVDRILQARGISALIILGLERPGVPINLDWEHYSVVSIGYSHPHSYITKISSRNRWATFRCVQELFENGYRKPALIVSELTDARAEHCWSAGFLSACFKFQIPADGNICLLQDTPETYHEDIISRIKKVKPDSIVTHDPHLLPLLNDNGYKVPQDLALVCLDVPPGNHLVTGICQNAFEIGQQSVNILFNLQVKNIRGLTPHEFIHLVSGTWMPGETMARPKDILV